MEVSRASIAASLSFIGIDAVDATVCDFLPSVDATRKATSIATGGRTVIPFTIARGAPWRAHMDRKGPGGRVGYEKRADR